MKRRGSVPPSYVPLDGDGRIMLSAETRQRGPGEMIGEFRIDSEGRAVVCEDDDGMPDGAETDEEEDHA